MVSSVHVTVNVVRVSSEPGNSSLGKVVVHVSHFSQILSIDLLTFLSVRTST